VGKVLDSAVANAENNHNLDADDLLSFRRTQQRPHDQAVSACGRASRIRKRTSHITVSVGEKKES
jgi:large subunit ribosomal protein L22